MDCKVIMTASCKGGVGKSTVCANLGLALANMGRRVLMIDCDFGMRSLDVIGGYTDEVIFDIVDCIKDCLAPSRAIVIDQRNTNLMFIAAPYNYNGEITVDEFTAFVEKCKVELDLDYILIDTHGGKGEEIELACAVSTLGLVVSTHHAASIRAADETRSRLQRYGVEECRLIVNFYDEKAARKKKLPSVIELIDTTHVQLLGVIPWEGMLMGSRADGTLSVENKKNKAGKAFVNIARRIEGDSIPLICR